MTRQQAGVSAEAVAKLVAKLPHSEHMDGIVDVSDEHCLRCQLEAALATATPEQGALEQNRDCGNNGCKREWDGTLLHRIIHVPPCTHTKDEKWLEQQRQPQAASAGALTQEVIHPRCSKCGDWLCVYIGDKEKVSLWWCGTCKRTKATGTGEIISLAAPAASKPEAGK